MVSFLDRVVFAASSGSSGAFVESAAVVGYQTMESAGAVDGKIYRWAAQSADLTQWEVGRGTWTAGTKTLTRDVVLFNSTGSTSAISFSAAPQVMITLAEEDYALVNCSLHAGLGGL